MKEMKGPSKLGQITDPLFGEKNVLCNCFKLFAQKQMSELRPKPHKCIFAWMFCQHNWFILQSAFAEEQLSGSVSLLFHLSSPKHLHPLPGHLHLFGQYLHSHPHTWSIPLQPIPLSSFSSLFLLSLFHPFFLPFKRINRGLHTHTVFEHSYFCWSCLFLPHPWKGTLVPFTHAENSKDQSWWWIVPRASGPSRQANMTH